MRFRTIALVAVLASLIGLIGVIVIRYAVLARSPQDEWIAAREIPNTDVNPYGANFFLAREVEPWKRERTVEMAQEAGLGWAKSILFSRAAREQFERYFRRPDTFALGVCNGCQALSALKELIAGAEHWPRFVTNRSEQFEGRLSLVEIQQSPSVLFRGMAGSRLPIPVAHGEGRAEFDDAAQQARVAETGLVTVRFVDHRGQATEHYPENPNGSPQGIAGLSTPDGRVTVIMPHPERVFRAVQNSWCPADWGDSAPWFRLFANARAWVG